MLLFDVGGLRVEADEAVMDKERARSITLRKGGTSIELDPDLFEDAPDPPEPMRVSSCCCGATLYTLSSFSCATHEART